MSRYIDADSLIRTLYVQSDDDGFICCGADDLETLINAQPTADVVEVVRCRDCEMFKLQDLNNPKHNTKWCVINGFNPQGGDYCSYGERKAND